MVNFLNGASALWYAVGPDPPRVYRTCNENFQRDPDPLYGDCQSCNSLAGPNTQSTGLYGDLCELPPLRCF